MKEHDETLFKTAVQALQTAEPDPEQISASAKRVAGRLGIAMESELLTHPAKNTIESCEDVRQLLGSYRAGTLSPARTLLVEAHLHDCQACLRQSQSQSRRGSRAAVLDWSTPKASRAIAWRPRAFAWVLAPCAALLLCTLFVYKAYWEIPPGVRAEVQSIDGTAYRISDTGDRQLAPGDKLAEGDHLRTSGGAHAVLRLADGSMVELNERSVVGVGARGHNMTIALENGAVIVQAAKRSSGHLYVKTPDCRVAVTGTVFSVNSGIKGSRVAVLQGAVHVAHAGIDSLLHAGDQITTSENLRPAPFEEEISWSHDRDKYLPLLAAFATLEHRIGQIPFPQPRYSSDLLARVPADTLLYVSIPNLGGFLSEANTIFHDQLKQSPELQKWWSRGGENKTEEMDALVDKIHDMSQYLGDEIVIVGVKQNDNPGFAIVADLEKNGLDDLLRQEFSSANGSGGLVVLDERSLASAPITGKTQSRAYALIRQREAVFSNSIKTLKQLNAQLNAGPSGFATGDFGKQITAAYGRGAGVILAADLHQMLAKVPAQLHARHNGAMDKSGMEGVRYLIAEHRENNGIPENHLNLQFSGTRQRVASWLAAPAPMGSLDFVTPNASVAVALLSKDPKEIADDIMAMADGNQGARNKDWTDTEAKLQISVRDDLVANLGGDFLLTLDGPVVPTPSWKAVIEVHDSQRLEQTLERLTQAIHNQVHGENAHTIAIEPSQVAAQRFFAVRDVTSGATVAQYTFADGFMIVAPTRALLIEALHTHASGNSLSRSAAFKALLPKDDNENYSAIAYQNLGPVLTPLLSQLSGGSADAIRKLAADAKPTAICAWGRDSRIEAASDSRLFGFDFLTLGTLLNSGNKFAGQTVKD
jgi:hypothetical protein